MEKKKMKLWKKIIILVLILFTIFAILTIRKFVIITNLSNEAKVYLDKTNYLAIVQSLQSGSGNILKSYNKDGNYLTTINVYGKNIQEKRGITIYNKDNEKVGIIEAGSKKIALLDGNVTGGEVQVVNILSIYNNAMQKLELAIISKITTDNCNGIECYLIELKDWKMWVDKNTGLVVREINAGTVLERCYEFDIVKDEDILKPDISDCELPENN